MKKLIKWGVRLLVVPVLLFAAGILFREGIAKSLLEKQIQEVTGMDVALVRVSIPLKRPVITIERLRLWHGRRFGDKSFADIPEIQMEYDLRSLLSRKLHFKQVRLNLAELHVIRNGDGENSFTEFYKRLLQSSAAPDPFSLHFVGIDKLTMNLGRFKYTDEENPLKTDQAWIGMKNQTIQNVDNIKDLEPLIIKVALERNAHFLTLALPARSANLPPPGRFVPGIPNPPLTNGPTAPAN